MLSRARPSVAVASHRILVSFAPEASTVVRSCPVAASPTDSRRTFATRRRRIRTSLFPPASGASSSTPVPSALSETTASDPFSLKSESGDDIEFKDYVQKVATLSPWVPCPDSVARRMLDLAKATMEDVHVDLGSGDGRVNFHAIDPPFSVSSSVGLEIDNALIQTSVDRLSKRHPKPIVDFRRVDLLSHAEESLRITREALEDATVVTMYFVEEALTKMKPILERELGNKRGVRVVTAGYEMKGWEARWVEVVLGMPIHLYVLDGDNIYDEEGEGMDEEGKRAPTPEEMRSGYVSMEPLQAEGATAKGITEEDLSAMVGMSREEAEAERVEGPLYDENETVDYHWDDFDDDDYVVETYDSGRGDGNFGVDGTKKKAK